MIFTDTTKEGQIFAIFSPNTVQKKHGFKVAKTLLKDVYKLDL